MNKINIRDINFSTLDKLAHQGSQSTIYKDKDYCYKILTKFYPDQKRKLLRKLLDIDGLKIDNVTVPIDLIMDGHRLEGFTMKYYKGAIPLSSKYKYKKPLNCKEFFYDMNSSTQILKNLNKSNIICSDLSFENILIIPDNNIVFCDVIESCSYDKHEALFISALLKNFMDYRKNQIPVSENSDKISMLLSFYQTIFDREIQKVPNRKYNKLSRNILTLQNLNNCTYDLLHRNKDISNISYLDEYIDITDDYIIKK